MGSYDVLLATNAICSAQHAATALQNCKALLRADGLLAVTEPTAKTEFFTLTIDLASAWWLHDDNTDQLAGSSIVSRYASHTYMHDPLCICRWSGVNMAFQPQLYAACNQHMSQNAYHKRSCGPCRDGWKQLMVDHGFRDVIVARREASTPSLLPEQAVVLALSDGCVRVFEDDDSLQQQHLPMPKQAIASDFMQRMAELPLR